MLLQESLREIWSVLRELDWFLACTIPLQCQVHATAVHYYWTPTVPKIVPEQSAPGAGVLPANFPAPRSLSLISPVRTQCPVRSAASLLLCPVFSSQPWTCNLILTSRMYMKVMCITSGLIFKGTEQAVPFFPAQCVWTCSHTGWMTCGGEPIWDRADEMVEQWWDRSRLSWILCSVGPLMTRATVPSQTSLWDRNKVSCSSPWYFGSLLLEALLISWLIQHANKWSQHGDTHYDGVV